MKIWNVILGLAGAVVPALVSAQTCGPTCVPNTGYPWPVCGCLEAGDLNNAIASRAPLTGAVFTGSVSIGSGGSLAVGGDTSWVNGTWPNVIGGGMVTATSPISEYGVIGISRTSDHTGTDSIGIMGLSLNNNTTNVMPVGSWAGYFEADVASAGIQTPTQGIEVDVGNSGTYTPISSWSMNPDTLTTAAWLACGGSFVGTNNCSSAIGILPNVKQFGTGIVLAFNALDPAFGQGGRGVAIGLADGQSLRWTSNVSGTVGELWAGLTGFVFKGTVSLVPPTSCAGQVTGTLYNNAGTAAFCP